MPGASSAPLSVPARGPDQGHAWRALHVYYYDEDKQDLLLSGVRPLLSRLASATSCLYFVRHWRGGPHLRIVVRADPDILPSVIAAAQRCLTDHLSRHPSKAPRPAEAALLAVHRRLAEMERDPAPLLPLMPDNSVVVCNHDRRLETLGGETGADLLAEFYDQTNSLAFRMLERIGAGQSLPAAGLSLMLATGHSFFGSPPSLGSGFVSFRSHADAFLEASSYPERTRARFDHDYQSHADTLIGLVGKVMDGLDHGTGAMPFVSEWVQVLRPFWLRARSLFESGHLALSEPTRVPRPERLERALYDSAGRRRALIDDVRFKQYRLMLSYTYLHLARLGIMAYDRFRLCHLAARAAEQALGLDARVVARRLHSSYASSNPEP